MVSIKKKKIKGKDYLYAEYSFRLPDGKVKKISKMIKEEKEMSGKNVNGYFLKKEIEAYKKHAETAYIPDPVITKEKIGKIESQRVEYRHLLKKLTKNQMSDILDRFTVNFTYESNAIEGNSLTLKDVTMILKENVVPKGKDLREVYETRNTRIANDLLFKGKIKITIKDIIKLHSILMKDTGVNEGFKKFPNFLMMRNVKTTPPEKVEAEMKRLVETYEMSKGKKHPLAIASDFHGKFEKIHPFEDGNGRVGRMIINAILLEKGYPPIIIRKTMRQSYFSVLEAFDKGHSQKLERFMMERLDQTFNKFFKIYVEYL